MPDWSVGDTVVALLPADAPGAAAEYVAAPAEALAPAPRTVDLADAAALPLVGLTAWQALFENAGLKPGQSILINGAGSAVGGYAVQLAVQTGATVTATAGARSRDRIRSYGADRIVEYAVTPVVQVLAGQHFDVVLQLAPAGPEENARLVDLVADGGAFVSVTTPGPPDTGRGVRTVHVFARSDAAQLAELVARADAGELAIEVAERLPLVDLPAVHARAAGRFARIAELAAQVEGRRPGRATACRPGRGPRPGRCRRTGRQDRPDPHVVGQRHSPPLSPQPAESTPLLADSIRLGRDHEEVPRS